MAEHTILEEIYNVVLMRKREAPPDSYTASLFRKGEDAILKKIAEESCELVLASKHGKTEEIIHESADLIFHLWVLLGFHEISPKRVYAELSRRASHSGLAGGGGKEGRRKK